MLLNHLYIIYCLATCCRLSTLSCELIYDYLIFSFFSLMHAHNVLSKKVCYHEKHNAISSVKAPDLWSEE